jgi:hypothetical protein
MPSNSFLEDFREEHRQLRDILLALRSAIELGDSEEIQQRISDLADTAGPHFFYEGEALYPALTALYGDEYVDRLQAEHEQTLAATRALAELGESEEFTPDESERALQLVSDLLPHIGERDGMAVVLEVLPAQQVNAIAKARMHARKTKKTIHEAGRPRGKRVMAKQSAPRADSKIRHLKSRAAISKALTRMRVKIVPKKRAK